MEYLFGFLLFAIPLVLLGFLCGWWHPGWVIFLLIPLLNWKAR